ncbi:hypothetical protein MBLNU459_g3437t1 [Dothideomycetes sp. NU459]
MKFSYVPAVLATLTLTTATSATNTASNASDICYVTDYAAVPAATAACTAITLDGLTVPGNSTLDLSKLKPKTVVTFKGLTTFEYAEANYNLILAGGTDIIITALPGAVIDGNGQAWWDGLGGNGGITKPDHMFVVSKALGNSVIKDLYIENFPTHCFSITGSDGLVMENIVLNNTAGDAPNARSSGLPAAHNTDGFDISTATNMILKDSVVINQDDCVAITSGDNITVHNMCCDGGHGLSIGSVGGKSNNNVTNIVFKNSDVLNSQNGARIKTNYNTTGFIANITYHNIAMSNISIRGIDIQQDYLNGGPTGTPSNGVIIENVLMSEVHGTVQPDATDYYILCGDGSCSDFTFASVNITGGTNNSCNFQPAGGFTC